LVGSNTCDDASVFQLREDLAIISTTDFFTPVVDDPFLFGEIAAANALSDVFAMGGMPFNALNILGFPQGKLDAEIVGEILRGGASKANEAGCLVTGGHTIQDKELKYGMAVNGTVHPRQIWKNNSALVNDVLILTKPLGTGAVSTALKRDLAAAEDIAAISTGMKMLNKIPVELCRELGITVNACTDITGYGLAGHLLEMLSERREVTIEVLMKELPLYQNAEIYLRNYEFLPGGFYRNREFCTGKILGDHNLSELSYNILFDPQTSGGLVLSMSEPDAEKYLKSLRDAYPFTGWIIGRVRSHTKAGLILID